MDMFTSYGHIKKPNKITDFVMILTWDSPFNLTLASFNYVLALILLITTIVIFHKVY